MPRDHSTGARDFQQELGTRPLAAIRFDIEDVDAFVAGLVASLVARGWRLSGLSDAACHSAEIDLALIGSGEGFGLAQSPGNRARGCDLPLDAAALPARALAQKEARHAL